MKRFRSTLCAAGLTAALLGLTQAIPALALPTFTFYVIAAAITTMVYDYSHHR